MKVIDLHTHVFNVRYLPVAGILHQRGGLSETVARGIAKLLNWRTGDRIGPGVSPEDRMLEVSELDVLSTEPARVLGEATPAAFIDDPGVREALAMIGSTSANALFDVISTHFDDRSAHALFQRLYAQVELARRDAVFESPREYLDWFRFLTYSEQAIVDRLLTTYGDAVQLFVHHMMDMEHYYVPGDCYYDFAGVQLERMKRLVDANGGRLLTFVAWSPMRPNALHVVRRAVESGVAAGVKVYPPSGYRPDDVMNDGLYDFCARRGVPLFAHCTPVGFEARPGYGLQSDPAYWRNVLHRRGRSWRELRLCLAHAGGAAPWFGGAPWKDSFAERAVRLATDPETPNVYLEFGHHDDILDAARRKQFAATLTAQIEASHGRLADRIVYGSDWHMIRKIPNHRRYLEAFEDAFSRPPLDACAERFFSRNAAGYLNLPAFAGRRGTGDPVRQHVESILAACG